MSLYIRKVTKSKWNPSVKVQNDQLTLTQGTDGVTNCCRTARNTISIWKVDSIALTSESDKKIIATLGSGSNNLSFIDYVIITDEELENHELQLSEPGEGGNSFIQEVIPLHYNIKNLNVESIARFGLLIDKKVSGVETVQGELLSEPEVKRIAENMVKTYILQYIPKNSLNAGKLILKQGFKNFYD